jgi:2-polyprenyl-3-methyl-5-hydroxy-6-metoxy-1,4-benzoquinol methylase
VFGTYNSEDLESNLNTKYFIPSSDDESERLSILHKIFFDPTVRFLNFAINSFPQDRLLKIADIGCGIGEMTGWLGGNVNAEVVGIDNDPQQITKATLRYNNSSNVSFECFNILDDVPSDVFDIVYCRFLLHHLPNPSDGIAKLIQMTRSKGKIIIGEPIMDGRWIYPHCQDYYKIYDLHLTNKASHMWDPNYGRRLLSDVSTFDQVRIDRFEHFRPILTTESLKRHHFLVLELFGGEFVKNNLISKNDLDLLKKQALHIASDPSYHTDLFGLVLVSLDKI